MMVARLATSPRVPTKGSSAVAAEVFALRWRSSMVATRLESWSESIHLDARHTSCLAPFWWPRMSRKASSSSDAASVSANKKASSSSTSSSSSPALIARESRVSSSAYSSSANDCAAAHMFLSRLSPPTQLEKLSGAARPVLFLRLRRFHACRRRSRAVRLCIKAVATAESSSSAAAAGSGSRTMPLLSPSSARSRPSSERLCSSRSAMIFSSCVMRVPLRRFSARSCSTCSLHAAFSRSAFASRFSSSSVFRQPDDGGPPNGPVWPLWRISSSSRTMSRLTPYALAVRVVVASRKPEIGMEAPPRAAAISAANNVDAEA